MALQYSAAVNRKSPTQASLFIFSRVTDGRIGRLYLLESDQAYVLRALNLVKLNFLVDVLDTFSIIRVATAYITPDGERITSFPADLSLVSRSAKQTEYSPSYLSPSLPNVRSIIKISVRIQSLCLSLNLIMSPETCH